MSILSFYNKILGLASLTSDVEGNINAAIGKVSRPFTISGKRAMLPTREVLRMPLPQKEKDNIIVFHPLDEHIGHNESLVLQQYRNAVNLTLNLRLIDLLGELLQLAASPEEHKYLKPAHLTLMSALKDADQKTFDAWMALKEAMPPGNSEKCLVHIFIRKSAHLGGKGYRRGAIVSFPLYEQLIKEDQHSVFGVRLRKKDFAAFKQLLEAVFPNVEEKNSYSRGSDADTAPSLDALLKSLLVLVDSINTVVETFEDLSDIGSLKYDTAWVEEASNLEQFYNELKLLPMQAGNEGSIDHQQGATNHQAQPIGPKAGSTPGTVVMPPNLMPQQNWQATQPAIAAASVINERGLVDMGALMRANPAVGAYALSPAMPGLPGMGFGVPTGAAALRMQGASWASAAGQFVDRGF